MPREIRKVAVLGAGVMGAGIAAHLANVGIPSYLLDIVPRELTEDEKKKGLTLESPEVRNRFAAQGLDNALKARPAAFYVPESADLITIGNFEDNLDWCGEVDWIIEVIIEKLDIKKSLLEKVEKHWKPGTIVSSNTSGISINAMLEGRSAEFKKHFLGTHFFNPPRYMKLLELIPARETDPEIVKYMKWFGETVLGKGIVMCKDTPNFIGNRIGVFGMLECLRYTTEKGYTVEEVDAITGRPMGRPKSATFRTGDIVGLDTLYHVASNVYDCMPTPEAKKPFEKPPILEEMMKRKWLGDKTKQGFYKVERNPDGSKTILALNLQTMEYVPQVKPDFPSLKAAKKVTDVGERLKMLVSAEDRAGQFVWAMTKKGLLYAASVAQEIADDIFSIDNAMKWGFNWELGPFESWDAIGLQESVSRMTAEGEEVPDWVKDLLESGRTSFYKEENGRKLYYDWKTRSYLPLPTDPRTFVLADIKKSRGIVCGNMDVSLVDLGDGVACLEFHSQAQAIGPGLIEGIYMALEEVAKPGWVGLVVGNQAQNYCVGANLLMVVMYANEGKFDDIAMASRQLQDALMAMKYFPKPVVTAPHSLALGGGCEIVMHGHRVVAAAETYMGCVEFGVGLLPAGGGCKELLLRNMESLPAGGPLPVDPLPAVARAFETIAMAKVATSGPESIKLGYMRPTDRISVSRDFHFHDAKQEVLGMAAAGFRPPKPAKVKVVGEDGRATLLAQTYQLFKGGYISAHDRLIANKIAYVLTGGQAPAGAEVSEQFILDLEREAFVELCREEKSRERMQYMLMNNKPLRN
ncbi:MAG: 3-hydroxyacyl-CoA dehydrogenase/enoyl-CoA hydratase family protein [Bacillota bacterium]